MAWHKLPVQLAYQVLGVSESGYCDWRSRPPSTRLALGIAVGHGAVELLMRRAGLAGLRGRRKGSPAGARHRVRR
jgi:hypothetical protein